MHACVDSFVCLLVHTLTCPFVCASMCSFFSFRKFQLICIQYCPSFRPSVRPSVRPSIYPSIHPSIHPLTSMQLLLFRWTSCRSMQSTCGTSSSRVWTERTTWKSPWRGLRLLWTLAMVLEATLPQMCWRLWGVMSPVRQSTLKHIRESPGVQQETLAENPGFPESRTQFTVMSTA